MGTLFLITALFTITPQCELKAIVIEGHTLICHVCDKRVQCTSYESLESELLVGFDGDE